MRVLALWRYPVKSLQGQPLDAVDVGEHGFAGDRRWGLVDVGTGLVLTARREPSLLFASAEVGDDGGVEVVLPDGRRTRDDRALSDWLGRPVELREATPEERGTYETPTDNEDEAGHPWITWQGPTGSFHDSTRTKVSIISTASMRDWEPRRFRANVVVSGDGEEQLVGSSLAIGTCRLDVVKRIDRCVVTTRPQPGGIERDLGVLRTVQREHDGFLGVGALVGAPGRVAVGEAVTVTPGTRRSPSP